MLLPRPKTPALKWYPMRFPWRLVVALVVIPLLTAAEPPADHLPAPQVKAAPSAPKRTLTGIDCTFGVACPIVWQPPRATPSPR
jgi:hypothetical protein